MILKYIPHLKYIPIHVTQLQ